MSDYMMMPGARLEIGSRGTPYETLGACCSSCARTGGSCSSSGLSGVSDRANILYAAAAVGIGLLIFLRRRRK